MGKTLTSATKVANGVGRPLRAVAYLRVSTEEQAKGYGISYSEKKVRQYFEKKGYEHVGTFADEGFSGSLEAHERPDLDRLMALARQEPRPFDLVGVNEGRVIGRTGRAFWRWVWELEDLGVCVAVVKKDYDNSTPTGRSQMRKDADYAEEERELIRERTQGGIQEAAEDGMYPGGQVPFGWTVKDGRYVVHKKAAATIRRGHEVFLATRSWHKVAVTWNAEGRKTALGGQWTRKNARRVLLGEAVLNNRVIWRGKAAAKDADGMPVFGKQVVIKLPKILKKTEASQLREAARTPARPVSRRRAYLLSGMLVSPCGSVYRGHNHRPGMYDYRCTGRDEKYAGAGGTCSCPALDVDAVEATVWSEVVGVLSDADRMKELAQEWISTASSEHVDHVSRIAQLDQQIAEQSQVLALSTTMTARQAAQRGLSGAEAEAAVEAATKPLMVELAELEKLRSEATAWQRDAEEASRRIRDFERLAEAARGNLGSLTPELRADLFRALEIEAEVVRCAPKRQGVACRITGWFTTRGRLVPELSDAAWERVEPLLRGRRSDAAPKRPFLEALLHKARTGLRFQDLAEQYGNYRTLQTQAERWLKSGAWEAAMELLKDEPGTPAWTPEPVDIKVSLRPLVAEFRFGDEDDAPSGVGGGSAIKLTFLTAA